MDAHLAVLLRKELLANMLGRESMFTPVHDGQGTLAQAFASVSAWQLLPAAFFHMSCRAFARLSRCMLQVRAPSCSASFQLPLTWTHRSVVPTWSTPQRARQTLMKHTM